MNVAADLMQPIQPYKQYMNHYDLTVPFTFGASWPLNQAHHKLAYTPAVYYTQTASFDLPVGTSIDTSYITSLSVLMQMMEAKVREYESLLAATPDVAQAEQVEYRLECVDPATRRTLSRMSSVSYDDHDVFMDYPADPLFS